MSIRDDLLKEIEAFLQETGMAPSTFGDKAMDDRTLMISLRKGRDLTSKTIDKLREFMAAERAKIKEAKRKSRPTSRLRAEALA